GDQLKEVARLAEAYGTGEVRLTPDQNVIIPNVPDAKLGNLTAEPLLKVLRYDPSEIMRGLVSCTGIEFCNLAVIETKARALQIARTLETKVHRGKPIRIQWSGCPAGCGNHTVADIGLLGVKALRMNGTEVAVFRCGNQLYALQNRCPHAGGSLADGTVEGDEVICPLHGYRFNIRTGACVTDPALRAKPVALVPHADGFTGAP